MESLPVLVGVGVGAVIFAAGYFLRELTELCRRELELQAEGDDDEDEEPEEHEESDEPRYLCWLYKLSASADELSMPVWLPKGEEPRSGIYVRAPWLDQQ